MSKSTPKKALDNAEALSVMLTLFYMNKSPLTAVLMVALAISALASLYLCYKCVTNASELSVLQNQAAVVNNSRAIMSAVATEALEYSKTNSAIDPILEAARIKPPSRPAKSTR